MKIAVAGLGLIGGSICKTLKKHTDHVVCGYDIDGCVLDSALKCAAIDEIIGIDGFSQADVVFVCLHPQETVDFILNAKDILKKGSVVTDVCGVKEYIANAVEQPLMDSGVYYVGSHPMAGREYSGFSYTMDTLFDHASFIITTTRFTNKAAAEIIESLARQMNFKEIVFSSPEAHDRKIAFTSQLAHVVSNAYIKSPNALEEHGFSAGSFLDLTRVAKLNAPMWTQLFMANADNLSHEIGVIIGNLTEYKQAIDEQDAQRLEKLLKEGSDIKELTLKKSRNS